MTRRVTLEVEQEALNMSVRSTLEAYVAGAITLGRAKDELRQTHWDIQRYTDEQIAGMVDVLPPPDNSPDWIQLVPGLAETEREAFTRIYDARRG